MVDIFDMDSRGWMMGKSSAGQQTQKSRKVSRAATIERVRQIVLQGLKGYPAEIYLFGSQATGKAGAISDIDVGVNPLQALPIGLLSSIRQELEESNVPCRVDLVDLSRMGREWLHRVKAEGVRWSD